MRTHPIIQCLRGPALALAALVGGAAAWADESVVAIKAGRVYATAEQVFAPGVVIIRGGKIAAVGPDLPIPDGATLIEVADGVVTAGLIDACCAIDFEVPQSERRREWRSTYWTQLAARPEYAHAHADDESPAQPSFDPPETHQHDAACAGTCGGPASAAQATALLNAGPSANLTWAEHSAEVIPHRLVIDAVNLLSNDFDRLLRGGVTTVFVSPDSASVIGARGAIVKTGGALGQRVVRRADAVKAALGGDPSDRGVANNLPPGRGAASLYVRRPTTRMGVDWVFRKALYDASRHHRGLSVSGADTPPLAALPVLSEIVAGKIPLRIQARMQHDIFSALRLAREFGLRFTLEEATEAYKCLPQLKAAGVPVVFGPLFDVPSGWRAFTGEADRPLLNTPAQLQQSGIPFALTAQELRDEEGLVRQAMMAQRYGLPADQALRAITSAPARLLGLEQRLGTLAPEMDADLVVWSAEPLAATSRVVKVLIDGKVVYGD